jgi:oxygen-independent coproporphyrinogen-3 oxidase
VRNPRETKFVYRDQLWTGADLIGLGVASFSHLAGTHFQNLTEYTQYLEAIARGDLPVSRAMATTEEERMIRELILQLKLGRVSRSYFQQKFGVNLAQRFAQEWDDLRRKELLTEEGDWFVLSRDALLKVDTLLHAFFLPQHKHARYT